MKLSALFTSEDYYRSERYFLRVWNIYTYIIRAQKCRFRIESFLYDENNPDETFYTKETKLQGSRNHQKPRKSHISEQSNNVIRTSGVFRKKLRKSEIFQFFYIEVENTNNP